VFTYGEGEFEARKEYEDKNKKIFEVLTALKMLVLVFWLVKPCRPTFRRNERRQEEAVRAVYFLFAAFGYSLHSACLSAV
jgi:hypothetical protein